MPRKEMMLYQDELLRQLSINMCAYLKLLLTKMSRCDASLLRRTTLWVRSILAVQCCRYGIAPPDTPKPTF